MALRPNPTQSASSRGGLARPLTRRVLVFAALLGLLLLALVLGVAEGTVKIGALEVIQAVTGAVPNPIITELRLPRVLGAMLVGAVLGLCGAAFQGLFRNPLADPYLMGSAAGAAFGVTVAVALAGGLTAAFSTNAVFERIPVSATLFGFLGAVGAVALTLLLSGGASRTNDLILAGVLVSSVLTSLTTLLLLHDANRVFSVFAYTVGNLAFVGWDGVRSIATYFLLTLGRTLNALSLGEETARSLGLPLGRLKLVIIGAVTLLTASAVAYAGIIGFVGLVAPHALRRILGGDYRYLLPASALGGAVLLAFADLLARVLVAPAELPVGVLTTLLGGPFFLYLMWRGRAR
ncbi:MAG: iron ABC transporter permease [Meiothermus sp.]